MTEDAGLSPYVGLPTEHNGTFPQHHYNLL